MPDPDIASLLFPTERPASTNTSAAPAQQQAQQADKADKADAAAPLFGSDKPAPAPAQRPGDERASTVFPTEVAPDPAAAVAETLNPWADSLHMEGSPYRADEMRAVSATLAEDFREGGMTAEDTAEVMGLAREALGNTLPNLPVSDERNAEMRADAEAYIAENQIRPEDIGLAQRLVRDLDAKTGGKVSAYLIDTGMGNDPRAIQRAVEIAKRRYC